MTDLLTHEDFQRVSGREFVTNLDSVPEDSGVYLLLIKRGRDLLDAAGYFALGGEEPWTEGQWAHLYTGSSVLLQTRLKRHLLGDARVSTFRKSLLALEAHCGALSATGRIPSRNDHREVALDYWLEDQCRIAFCPASYFADRESELLSSTPSPLNITGRRSGMFSRRLMAMRSILAGRRVLPHCVSALAL